MPTGTCKWFSEEKCYGFIKPDAGGPDAFVHLRDLQASGLSALQENQRVRYEMLPGKNGKDSAKNIVLI